MVAHTCVSQRACFRVIEMIGYKALTLGLRDLKEGVGHTQRRKICSRGTLKADPTSAGLQRLGDIDRDGIVPAILG